MVKPCMDPEKDEGCAHVLLRKANTRSVEGLRDSDVVLASWPRPGGGCRFVTWNQVAVGDGNIEQGAFANGHYFEYTDCARSLLDAIEDYKMRGR